ncbi:hypothetical protein HYU11_05960 [Candidatus Woesearchaeota archaeon]|nr:hypothetical protein [Candidatus Woesearchaeota archaeon]
MKALPVIIPVLFALLLLGCTRNTSDKTILVETGIQTNSENPGQSLNEYYSTMDFSCKTDSDCEAKDVRNCCGYYPQCVNSGFRPDPDLVSKQCEKEKSASICGFPEIESCKCINKRCEPN